MMECKSSFSFPSYRRLCQYLGETDALVELTELAARSFIANSKQSIDIKKFISEASESFGIRVNISEFDQFAKHLSRSYIVTVYHSAERFLHEFRREHIALYSKEWSGDGGDVDPLTVTLRNITSSEKEMEEKIGLDLISRFQYYRIVRNWIVHEKGGNSNKPQAKYKAIVEYSDSHQAMFSSSSTPHAPEELDFDDFMLFSRLTKFIASKISEISKPPDKHWLNNFSLTRFKKLENNPARMSLAICGSLRTEYGMDEATAQRIAQQLIAH
jgi:hypothetical protein